MLGALSRPLIVTINTSTGSRTQNNATQYWLATHLSGYTVRNCWCESNKSDNNNAGVAQLGMASSACQQLPIYIYEIYMKLDLSITMRVLLLKHCNACPSSSDTHGAPLPMKSIGRQTLFHGPRVTGYLLSGASTLVHHHRCITSGALLLVHHLWYIPSGASRDSGHHHLNIARGTTDPEIDSMTCISWQLIVANLATRWRHLH